MSWERWVDWLDEAEDDLASAKELYRAGRYAKACFLAQQAAEKALKALLIRRAGVYERTHSVAALLERARQLADVTQDLVDAAELLDRYYVPSRYPNAWPSGSPSKRLREPDARSAIEAAEKILGWVRENLGGEPDGGFDFEKASEALAGLVGDVLSVVVFGSAARGRFVRGLSDVDVLVITPGEPRQRAVTRGSPVGDVNAVFMSRDEFCEALMLGNPIAVEASMGIVLLGEDPGRLCMPRRDAEAGANS